MIKDIQKHIELVDGAIAWANEFGKDSFPLKVSRIIAESLKKLKMH